MISIAIQWRLLDFLSIESYRTVVQEENDDSFLSVHELLHDAGEAQQPQRVATSVDFRSERADDDVGYINSNDRDDRFTSQPKGDKDERKKATDSDNVYSRDDDSVFEERDKQYSALGSPQTIAFDSDARCDPLTPSLVNFTTESVLQLELLIFDRRQITLPSV